MPRSVQLQRICNHRITAMSHEHELSRRELLNWGISGIGGTALLSLLNSDSLLGDDSASPFPNFPAKAKRAVHICLVGGMSHVDSFDYKPELTKSHGKSLNAKEKPDIFFGKVGQLRRSDWEFKRRGKSGLWVSDMFPHIASLADDLTLFRGMVSDSANHTPALFFQNSGFGFNGYPSMGSWCPLD